MEYKECPTCGSKIEEGDRYCGKCRHEFNEIPEDRFKIQNDFFESNRFIGKINFLLLSMISYFISLISVCMGFYKMFAYDNSKYGGATNTYVGGDAYNYIINAQYSVAWFTLAVLFAVIGFTFLYCHLNLNKGNKE